METILVPRSARKIHSGDTRRRDMSNICPFKVPTCPGCKMVHEPLTEEQRTQHQMLFWRTMAEIVSIQSPALHLSQLRQAFINSYFSMGIINSNRQHFNIFYWMAPQSPAMDAARDAFCMIHLGSRHRDQQLITAGLLRHVAAIRWLRGDIGKPTALTDDSVLGAAYTLGQTEVCALPRMSGRNPYVIMNVS